MEKELLQRGLGKLGRSPHAARATLVVKVLRAQRPARGNFRQECFREFFFARRELTRPWSGAAGAPVHLPEQMWPGFERKGYEDSCAGHMVLKSAMFRLAQWRRALCPVEEAHQVSLAVAGHAIAQDEIVHATRDIDRVDLDVAVVRKCRADVGMWSIQAQGGMREAAGGGAAQCKRRGHAED